MYDLKALQNILDEKGYSICEYTVPVNNCKESFVCKDSEGYYILTNLDRFKNRKNGTNLRFGISNPYSIININHEAKLKGYSSVCIDDHFDSKERLLFKCECNEKFRTNYYNFLSGKKTKCHLCTNYRNEYSYDMVKDELQKRGYHLLVSESEYKGITLTPLICSDETGYKHRVTFNKIMNGRKSETFHPANPFTLDNIKLFLVINNLPFECLSDEFISCSTSLKFRCKRCGEEFYQEWQSINVVDTISNSRGHLRCPNCDYTVESTHASVLKQVFLHEHPDTIVEDRSFISPVTNHVMPTDIVNHRLKIAIEIQSQWHDFADKKWRDEIKKQYWLERGYSFYDPDIRDYSILELCQLFFNIDSLPDYVDYQLNKKINIRLIQEKLNNHMSVAAIAKELNIGAHRIYNAIYNKNLQYPEDYQNGGFVSVEQYDINGNLLKVYPTIAQAAKDNDMKVGYLTSVFHKSTDGVVRKNNFILKRIDVVKNA